MPISKFGQSVADYMENAIQKTFPPVESVAPVEPTFQIFVKTGKGTITLDVSASDTGLDVKHKIAKKAGLPVDADYWLSYSTTSLGENETVGSKKITKEATLEVRMRGRGGIGERAAITSTGNKDIKRGNVKGDISLTHGESKVLKDWARDMYSNQSPESQALLNSITQRAIAQGLCTPATAAQWYAANEIHIQALIIETAQGGNCGDFAQVVHSHLLENTAGQYVYQVVMTNPYDHQFVVTSPTNHGSNVATLAADANAMVADAWWANKICSFIDFVGGNNPYNDPLTPSAHLQIVANTRAEGRQLDAALKNFITNATAIRLNAYKSTAAFAAAANYNDANVETLNGTFGDSAQAWGNDMDDSRSNADIYRTVNNAFAAGAAQFIAECNMLDDEEFIDYALNLPAQMGNVWNVPATQARFLAFCNNAAHLSNYIRTDTQRLARLLNLNNDHITNAVFTFVDNNLTIAIIYALENHINNYIATDTRRITPLLNQNDGNITNVVFTFIDNNLTIDRLNALGNHSDNYMATDTQRITRLLNLNNVNITNAVFTFVDNNLTIDRLNALGNHSDNYMATDTQRITRLLNLNNVNITNAVFTFIDNNLTIDRLNALDNHSDNYMATDTQRITRLLNLNNVNITNAVFTFVDNNLTIDRLNALGNHSDNYMATDTQRITRLLNLNNVNITNAVFTFVDNNLTIDRLNALDNHSNNYMAADTRRIALLLNLNNDNITNAVFTFLDNNQTVAIFNLLSEQQLIAYANTSAARHNTARQFLESRNR